MSYERDGFTILRQALVRDEIEALIAEAEAICRGERGHVMGLDERPADDVLARYLAIHHPHKISPVAMSVLKHPAIVTALTELVGPNIKSMQSMLFIKSAGKPGQAWHQDEYFIPTRDRSLTAAWIAIDDATVENGCLWVLPGSHRRGMVYPLQTHDDARFDMAQEAYGFPESEDDAVAVELAAGDVLLFNGYLLHRSLPNRAPAGTYRRALVNHYMRAEALLSWHVPCNGVEDFRDIVLVAGEDPYAWKGTADFHTPHIRPVDGEQREAVARDRVGG